MSSSPFDKLFAKSVPHIHEKIFLSLDYESFKNCLEVNFIWHKLLTSEAYKTVAKAKFKFEIAYDQWKLCVAAGAGNGEEVKRLLSSGMLNINRDWSWGTSLYEAVTQGHKEVVQILLNNGANPNKGRC